MVPDQRTTENALIIYLFIRLQNSLVEYFSRGLLFFDRILKRLWLGYLSINKTPLEVRNVLLVVTIFTATATYQAALSSS